MFSRPARRTGAGVGVNEVDASAVVPTGGALTLVDVDVTADAGPAARTRTAIGVGEVEAAGQTPVTRATGALVDVRLAAFTCKHYGRQCTNGRETRVRRAEDDEKARVRRAEDDEKARVRRAEDDEKARVRRALARTLFMWTVDADTEGRETSAESVEAGGERVKAEIGDCVWTELTNGTTAATPTVHRPVNPGRQRHL